MKLLHDEEACLIAAQACIPLDLDDGRPLASGAIIKVAGITGRIWGVKFKRPDGKVSLLGCTTLRL